MDRDVTLLCNPSAGGGRAARILPRVERALRALEVGFHTELTRDLDHARQLTRRAAQDGELTVTLGGDGLIGSVVGVLREFPQAVLGILPGGRGNDTARMLGIPRDVDAACAVIARGVERDLDVGDVDGRSFIGIASLGLDADANRFANTAPARLGGLVYAYGVLRALATWRHARFELRLDDQERSFTGYSIAACNSAFYGGGMRLAPDAEIDDGLLDVILIGEYPKPRFVATLPKVFRGTHVDHPAVSVLRAGELRVDADRPLTIYADGDPIGSTPATISVLPRALRVLVPG